ncbi:helix-turn-helix domain-containing protein [Sphingobium baderi]|uniref:helix-turn-helix domain-containing protein n=1 Tax=Sphingobium baderi TaxID=1332080 RepID=UPI003977E42A
MKKVSLPRIKLGEDVVKSAARAMQVIEFMDTIRRPVSVVELARYLDYPQSSVSGLVQTLLVLGYLHFDPVDRTYTLSSKVSFMGLWVRPIYFVMAPSGSCSRTSGQRQVKRLCSRRVAEPIPTISMSNRAGFRYRLPCLSAPMSQ